MGTFLVRNAERIEKNTSGEKDIHICCVDGLIGFSDAIAAEFPEAGVQKCIIH